MLGLFILLMVCLPVVDYFNQLVYLALIPMSLQQVVFGLLIIRNRSHLFTIYTNREYKVKHLERTIANKTSEAVSLVEIIN
jgi:hypothetical protein